MFTILLHVNPSPPPPLQVCTSYTDKCWHMKDSLSNHLNESKFKYKCPKSKWIKFHLTLNPRVLVSYSNFHLIDSVHAHSLSLISGLITIGWRTPICSIISTKKHPPWPGLPFSHYEWIIIREIKKKMQQNLLRTKTSGDCLD